MRWSYKTVHYELKKEGLLGSAFLDESEVELSLNEFGRAGWELVSMLETMDGIIAIFKQPLFDDSSPLFRIRSEAGGGEEPAQAPKNHPRERVKEVKLEEQEREASEYDGSQVVDGEIEERNPEKEKSVNHEGDVGAIRIE
jgi:hypothetical protein